MSHMYKLRFGLRILMSRYKHPPRQSKLERSSFWEGRMKLKSVIRMVHTWGLKSCDRTGFTVYEAQIYEEITKLLEILKEDDCVLCWKGVKHVHKKD